VRRDRNEYVIHAKLKNNLLLSRILERYPNVAQFCREHELSNSAVGELIGLKKKARHRKNWITLAKRLADALSCEPEDLFTEEQSQTSLATNEVFIDISRDRALAMANPLEGIEAKQLLDILAAPLDGKSQNEPGEISRQRKIEAAKMRYMEDRTYKEIGEKFQVCTARAADLCEEGLRTLRHRLRKDSHKLLGE
jgi:DNA-directed RNA polymerase specialized sigma subunit